MFIRQLEMAAEEGKGTSVNQTNGMASANGVALLLVVGEPFSDDQKELILERISRSLQRFQSSVAGFDLNGELQAIATAAPSGEQFPNGETVIEHNSEQLRSVILVNPQIQTFSSHLRNFLLLPAQHRVIVYSGGVIQGCGSWILQDDLLSFATFHSTCKEAEIQNALKQNGGVLDLHFIEEGDWTDERVAKKNLCKDIQINISPSEAMHDINGILQFTAYLSYFIKAPSCKDLLQSSDVVGNIRFTRPTLYVFPGSHGDSALFGISGFNLLVNSGYNKKACFWGFTRHLDRIDAMLMTHLGPDNIFGVSSVFERKAIENVHPEIGYIYCNTLEKVKHSSNGDIDSVNGGTQKPASLVVSMVHQANQLVENMKLTGQCPHSCFGQVQNNILQPLNLYHNVSQGTLDMYILNPMQDSKDVKDFLAQWNKGHFTTNKNGIPIPNQASICALLVWKPTSPYENITRILFPGNAPQDKIFEGLDKLKTLDIFKVASCTEHSLNASKSKKPGPAKAKPARGPPNARASPVQRGSPIPAAKVEPKRPTTAPDRKPAVPKPSAAASKPAKDAKNKKTTGSKEEKDKGKKTPTSSSSASKGTSPVSESSKSLATPSTEDAVEKPQLETIAAEVAASLQSQVKSENEIPPEPKPTFTEPEPAVPEKLSTPSTPEEPVSVAEPVPVVDMPAQATPEAVEPIVAPEDVQPELNQTPEPTAAETKTGDLLGDLSYGEREQVANDQSPIVTSPVLVPDPAIGGLVPEPEPVDLCPPIIASSPTKDSVLDDLAQGSAVEDDKLSAADTSEASQASTDTDTATAHSPDAPVDSPEALPDPHQFDAATLEAVAMKTSLTDEKVQESFDASVDEQHLQPEAEQACEAEQAPEAEQACEAEQAPEVEEAPGNVAEAEQEIVQAPVEEPSQEVPDLAKEDFKLDVQPDKISISSEDEQELPTPEEFRNESAFTQPPEAGTLPEEASQQTNTDEMESERKQSLAEFGIYEDDSILQQSLEEVDSKTMTELGLVDDVEAGQVIPAHGMPAVDEADNDSLLDNGPDSLSGDRQTDSLEHLAANAPVDPSMDFGDDQQTPVVREPPNSNPFEGMQLDTSTQQNTFHGVPDDGSVQQNPFGIQLDTSPQQNPFDIPGLSAEQQAVPDLLQQQVEKQDRDSLERDESECMFDPLKDWGQPMGLPAPTDGAGTRKEPAKKADSPKKPSTARGAPKAASAGATRKPADSKKTAAGDVKKSDSHSATSPRKAPLPALNRTTKKSDLKSGEDAAKKPSVRDAATKKPASAGAARKPTERSAPAKVEPKSMPSRGSAMARKTGAPATTKTAPAAKLTPVTPFYIDLGYIPAHGDPHYVNKEFFRKIRARYYVLSSLNPSAALLNALLEAKQTWEDPSLEVTIIPTYDTDTLRHWMGLNRDQLCQLNIDFAPSASRCTIQLQDHEASCAAYRLDF